MSIVIFLAVLIAAALAFASSRPDTFRVERSTTIHAAPEAVFPHINDLARWQPWSPWEKLDPAIKREMSASTSGKGATYAWEGNKKVGQGSMEITESIPASKIVIRLAFLKPFKATNTVEFTLTPQGGDTHVVWAMDGARPFMAKVAGLFMNCDKMVGKSFAEGLASMKALIEKGAPS
jgi:uncharacterized protein YndB with AHSA1/START domain